MKGRAFYASDCFAATAFPEKGGYTACTISEIVTSKCLSRAAVYNNGLRTGFLMKSELEMLDVKIFISVFNI
jgi:hypothetical protein